MANFPEPAQLAAVSPEELTGLVRKWSRGYLGRDKASRLIALAGKSVGIKEGATNIGAEVKYLIGQLDLIEQHCLQLESQIEQCLKQAPEAALLLTIPGFGIITVAGILANTGNLADYEHPEEALKLAGLNLFEISSGKHKGKLRISKRGRPQLRKFLYMAALQTTRRGNPFRQYYERLINRGVGATASLVSVMRKLLRLSWSLVRNRQEFDVQRLNQTETQRQAA
jgi:transposase